MKMIKLEKLNEPKFDELFGMIADLKTFLDEDANLDDRDWNRNLNTILDFQDPEGTFKLLNLESMPNEARIDFIYIPTYICSSILMKAFMRDSSAFNIREKSALSDGLKASCARNLRGHGYGALKGQIESLKFFMKAGLREFIDIYPDLCPEFTEMIEKIISRFQEMESQEEFRGSWGESYEDDIRAVNEYFCHRNVFVYGTLMKGEANEHYLEGSVNLAPATIKGYDMYDVGWYPAIVDGNGLVIGELYRVPLKDMPSIDRLEGEGSLYAKRCETVTDANGESAFALVYVYLGDVSGLKRIPSWKEYVWYVSYGSNMLRERFMCYIKGGSFEASRNHPACRDTTPPLAVKAVRIPYGMYFGNISGSWPGSGVSFLDTTQKGSALGVAYLITKEQFEHVCRRENDGRSPTPGCGWYEDIIDLEPIDGMEVKTITNNDIRPYNDPIPEYLNTLRRGIRENWPDMSDEEIDDYLDYCTR